MDFKLLINGKDHSFPAAKDALSLQDVIGMLSLTEDRIALELNGEIAPRARWHDTQVQPGDRLEIVHFVGGGCMSASEGVTDSKP